MTPLPAHRPSRRQEIVDAAIRRFAESGYVDTSIADVAAAAGVAPTAVYYHFDGKDDLFTAAVGDTMASISEVVGEARASHAPGDPATLDAVIDAVWEWIDDHPAGATLLYVQLPSVTHGAASRFAGFQDRHVDQALGYFTVDDPDELDESDRAAATLRARTLVGLTISIHSLRLGGGLLGDPPPERVRRALRATAARLVVA